MLSNLINNSAAVLLLFARKNRSLRRSPNFNRRLLAILRRSFCPVRLSIIPYVSTAAAGPQAVTCDSTCHDAQGESRWSVKTDPLLPPTDASAIQAGLGFSSRS
jgi:hypothetical protein